MRDATPGVVTIEDAGARWLLDVLDLPRRRGGRLRDRRDDGELHRPRRRHATRCCTTAAGTSHRDGLIGAPRVRVLAGAERHSSVDMALRYLGLGHAELVPSDEQGRIDPVALRAALAGATGVRRSSACRRATCTPARSTRSSIRSRPRTRSAPGCTSTARSGCGPPRRPPSRTSTDGMAGADSWATDAHKTLNVPYDCGVAIVADPTAISRAFGHHAEYLIDARDPGSARVRARALAPRARASPSGPRWHPSAATACASWSTAWSPRRAAIADGLAALPGATIVNDVVYTQVCVAFEDDDTTTRGARRDCSPRASCARARVAGAIARSSASRSATGRRDADEPWPRPIAAFERRARAAV